MNDINIFKDGDQWCAVGCDFVDLQQSNAGFGDTPVLALEAFCMIEGCSTVSGGTGARVNTITSAPVSAKKRFAFSVCVTKSGEGKAQVDILYGCVFALTHKEAVGLAVAEVLANNPDGYGIRSVLAWVPDETKAINESK